MAGCGRVDPVREDANTIWRPADVNGYVSLFHGPRPELAACSSEKDELQQLKEWIDRTVQGGIQISDIGVLVNTRAAVERVCDTLRRGGLEVLQLQANRADDRSLPGVRVTTMHRSKGLEFFAVAVPFLSDSTFPPAGALRAAVDDADRDDILERHRSLLHVAATRAKKALRVSWSGKPSALLRPTT